MFKKYDKVHLYITMFVQRRNENLPSVMTMPRSRHTPANLFENVNQCEIS